MLKPPQFCSSLHDRACPTRFGGLPAGVAPPLPEGLGGGDRRDRLTP
ncbi:MAG: hypothetical protein MH825_15550 [Cyanobacteria bacterium]|nr:hypothetical protein [Cyanobacteriota bacterium]